MVSPVAGLRAGDGQLKVRGYLLPMACVSAIIALVTAGILLGVIPSITLLTMFLASVAAVFVLFRAGDDYDVLHPVRVFGAVWCACLALASLRLVTIISVWGLEMWTYVFVALVAFVGGFWLMSQHLQRKWRSSGSRPAHELPKSEFLAPERTLILALLCLGIGVFALGYQYWQIGAIPIFAPDIDEARTTFAATAGAWRHPEFDTLTNKFFLVFGIYCKYSAYLATIVLVQKSAKTKAQRIVAWSVTLCALAALGSMGGRGFFVEYSVVGLTLFHYLRRRISLKEFGVVGLLLALFLSAAGYWRGVVSHESYTHDMAKRISNLPPGPLGDSAAFGVFKLTTSFEVFNRLLQDAPALPRPTSGFLFYSFHRFVPRENIQELTADLYTIEMITPTFLGEFYLDLGGFGIIVGPLILGGLFGYVYSRALRYTSIYWLVVQTIFMSLLVYFSYVNLFSQNINWILDTITMAFLIKLAQTGKKARIPAISSPQNTARLGPRLGRARQGVPHSARG